MRDDFGNRPYSERFPYGSKNGSSKKQGYNDRLDESLGARNGAKSHSLKARRDESKGMEKASGNRAYSSVSTMDK